MIVQLLNGLAFGVLLLVLSSGLALIFGLRGIVNFAHGAVYMIAAYVGFTISEHVTYWVALIATPVAFAAIGVLADRYGFRYLSHRGELDMVLLTFGLTFVLTDVVQSVWGLGARTVDAPAGLNGSTSVGGVEYPTYRLFVIAVGLAVGVALILWLRRSTVGLHVRASSTARNVAAVVGIDVDRVSAIVVGLGAGMAGLAGVLAGPYLSLSPTMGAEILVLTFIVVVVGGLGSIGGAMAAALILGLLSTLSSAYSPDIGAYVPYLLMVVVLLVRPRGLAGTRSA